LPTLIIRMTIQGIHGTEDASEELESVLTPAQLKKLDLMGNVPAQLMTEITRGLDRMNEHKVSFLNLIIRAIQLTLCFFNRTNKG